MRGFSRILGWRQKKLNFHLKNARIFTNSGVKPQKKKDLYYTFWKKKTVLAHEFWGDNHYLGSLRPQTALSGTEPVTFFGAQSSLGRHSSCLEGTSSDLGRARPRNAPRGRRAYCKFTAIYQFISLQQVYSNNCNYRIFVKEILFKIGFIEEIKAIWGNKEVPQTFFHNFLDLRKYDLIRLTPYHCQPCIRNFVTIQKA